ncbi:hypothetical protein GLOTRDRAFT_131567 [Gloeophyllum trabeum ATCC 11539]|uniref:F-box domain-containing protein n=1 Tax=Gloeophyllum trabeum (strain ATCC 11539 / FP-39264 / Madison 617) TaxID=670483 RepID=S7RKU9_GLOTA|nr:uncharacterized protein GLOTRDRAFT_131567 [Gloeophyllum trabeum ATCC 11539]EPQ53299.1 hypothetical protein GLOTRDRAFT_131567 [Gloeophyllum trabeum ATCC 11539]
MFCLTAFTFLDCSHPPAQLILDALSHSPSLASVEFCRTPIDTLTPSFSFVALENLSIKCGWKLISVNGGPPYDIVTYRAATGSLSTSPVPDLFTKMSQSFSRRSAELSFSTLFIKTNLAFLERVEIEGALFPFGILQSTLWPRLHTLIFYGRPPVSQTVPLISLFGGMPILRDLQFRWATRLVDRQERYIYVPQDLASAFHIDISTMARSLPSIRSLTLSNVVPEDHVFRSLPSTLSHLHLPTILEDGEAGAGIRASNLHNLGIGLTGAGASAVIREIAMSRCSLRELRMTLADMPTPAFIRDVSVAFQTLQVLELGQAWYDAFVPELVYSEASYTESLSSLRHIQELRLALPFTSEGRNRRFMWFGPTTEELDRARRLATVLLGVRVIAFQCTYAMNKMLREDWNEWATYRIQRDHASIPSVSWVSSNIY